MDSHQLSNHIDQLLLKKQDRHLKSLLVKEEPHTIAEALEDIEKGAVKTFGLLPPEVQAEVALTLSEVGRERIVGRLSDFTIARFLHFLDENDGADILQVLPVEKRPTILEKLRDSQRKKIEKLLTYDPETAGGLMDLNFITVSTTDTILDVTRRAQEIITKEKQTPTIVILNNDKKPIGIIPYKNLVTFRQDEYSERAKTPLPIISVSADQEHVLELLLDERADVAGVVDTSGIIVGIMRVADLLRVVQSEATEDLFKFAGVSAEESIFDSPFKAFSHRYKWLVLNLGTAFIASFVVSQFESSIAQLAILAAYMPIVAGMGGNAGTQTLAVVVRSIALGELSWHDHKRVIIKEITTGFLDGFVVALVAVPLVFLLSGQLALALVLGASLIINLIVAGLFGALIPLTLKVLKVDPAVASSVFVTTATDVCGFLVFLGLATAILL